MNELEVQKNTMTSLELFDMLDNFSELKELHRGIRTMFPDEIKDGVEITPSLDSRGYVKFYVLNEITSKMFVASKDKKYLRKITQYWIDKSSSEPQIPQTYGAALLLAGELQIKVESQELELKIAQPKIEVHDKIVSTVSLTDLLQTSKLLGLGRNKFMKFLRNQNILMSQPWNKNIPYQKYCDLGYFEVKTTTWQDFEGNEHINNKCMVTGKGLTWLTKNIKK